jgi:ribosomal RNA assembly protein|tara:strand:- start:911 stop:1642 length:732 start_codon:yes stop_codon:yes gene_type:complete
MEHLARIPKDRIAVLIGKRGATRKMIEKACGGLLEIDSKSGEVHIQWNSKEVDPIVRMKMPDVISSIGRGLAPKRALQLIQDDIFLRMYDIREWVGRQPNQIRRMRSRLIGTNGRIRTLIEELSGCEIAIYGSTVLVIGDNEGLAISGPAIESILRGSEHGTVLHGLEQDRRRQRLHSRSLETYQDMTEEPPSNFDILVPGLADARRKAARKFTNSTAQTQDDDGISEMLQLAEDEEIIYEEE